MFKNILTVLPLSLLIVSCSTFSPHQVTTHKVGPKTGEACATYVLPFLLEGENTIAAAAKNGKIKSISTVDTSLGKFFPFYYKRCTKVTGK